ncbi:MAG: MCE family protein [Chitinispirillaceae bacterium]|nr:MCE family protein [Chitinispirillaceae bacterium]
MKKTNMDLMVGASIIIALFILIFGVLWLKEAMVSKKMVSYTVLFPNVGTLQLGDPVMTNGVTKGRVKDIYLRENHVAAVIHLEKGITLTDSCIIKVQNIGLMGERGIGIELKRSGTPFQPSKRNDTTFCEGSFDTGIAEAMGMMGTVLTEVEELLTNVSAVLSATVGDTTFLELFQTLTRRLDTLTAVAGALVTKNGPRIEKSIANVSDATAQLKELLEKNSGHIDTIVANADRLSAYSLDLMKRVDGLTGAIQGIVEDLERGNGALGMLVKDKRFQHDLKRTVADVDTLVREVRNDALKLRIKLKLFGSDKKK